MTRRNADKSSDLIDKNLRRAFQQFEEEELPDRFKDLLDKLKTGKTVETSDGKDGA